MVLTNKFEIKYRHLYKAMVAVLSIWILTALITIYALLDGDINPVTTRLEITDIYSVPMNGGNSWYQVIGEFEKIRDCDIVTVRWFYGNRRESSRVSEIPVPTLIGPDVDVGSTPNRVDVGDNVSRFLRVRLDPELIESNSYAYVYHRCYGPWFWKTRTLFYESQ